MGKRLFFLLFLTTFLGFSQRIEEPFNSLRLGEIRDITITLPESYERSPKKKFPLIVLLDGDYLVNPFEGAIKYGNYFDDFPEVIIVGINQNGNKERVDDCAVESESGMPEEKTRKFFEFIGMELVPYIQKKYRVAPFKIIAGHDITAGFLNLFLFNDDLLFSGYISMSPELPLKMDFLVEERLFKLETPIYYYQSTSDSDDKIMKYRIKQMDSTIQSFNKPNINYKAEEFKGSSHYSMVLNSIPNALYQIFAGYRQITISEYNEKIVKLPSGYVDYLKNKYEMVEKMYTIKMPIRYIDFKAIQTAILKNQAFSEMEQLAELAKKHYPKSMLADYLLANMYEERQDFANAKKFYKIAFQRDPIGELTRDDMLDKVQQYKDY